MVKSRTCSGGVWSDEADSILIDEARTPLIISETTEAPAAKYEVARDLAEGVLSEGIHYDVDRKGRAVTLNENGYAEAEGALGRPLVRRQGPLGAVPAFSFTGQGIT